MEESEDQICSKKLNINKLGRKEKQKALFEAFIAYPSYVGYSERLHSLASRVSTTAVLMFQHARRHGWQKALEHIVVVQKEHEAFAKVLDERAPLYQEIPFSTIQKQIKASSWLLLTTGRRYVQTASLMMDYYGTLIADKVSETGGVHLLDAADLKLIEGYYAQLQHYAKSIENYIKPQAITALLQTINFSQQIPADTGEVDTNAFTFASLQAKLLQMGMGTAFDDPDKAAEGFGPIPDLPFAEH